MQALKPPARATALLAILAGLILAMLAATPAYAHATIVSSSPERDTIVDTAPSEVVIEFSETVSVVAGETGVIAPDGKRADAEPATTEGNRLTYTLRDDLPQGTYLVSYRVISADGHPVPGGYSFSIGKRSATPEAELSIEADPLVDALVIGNRYLGYLGLALALGPGLLLVAATARKHLAGKAGTPLRGVVKLMTIGLCVTAATSMIGLYLQVPYTAGTTVFGVTGADVGAVLSSRFGAASLLRLLPVLVALPLLRHLVNGRASSAAIRWTLGVLTVVLTVTWPLSGHATTSPAPPLTVLSDTVHITAMGLWVGGLVTLMLYLGRPSKAHQAEEFLPTWSRWATWLVAGLAVAGLAQALIEIGTVEALLSTEYGVLVMVKVALFAVLLGVAAFARTTLRRNGSTDIVRRVRRLIIVELVVALVILGVSSLLVQTVPAAVAVTQEEDAQEAGLYSTELKNDLYTLQFELEPVALGDNTAHLYLFTPQGEPLEALEWSATYGQPGSGIAPVGLGLALLSPNHCSADVAIPTAGEWEFTFTIRISELERQTVSAVVTVK